MTTNTELIEDQPDELPKEIGAQTAARMEQLEEHEKWRAAHPTQAHDAPEDSEPVSLIERLAREAGITEPLLGRWMTDYGNSERQIRKFAALVAEECAKVADEYLAWQEKSADLIGEDIREKFQYPG